MNETTTTTEARSVARRSALTYTGLSLASAAAFFLAATLVGSYGEAARFGGAAWVFLLTMIVTMPLVTSFMKKRAGLK